MWILIPLSLFVTFSIPALYLLHNHLRIYQNGITESIFPILKSLKEEGKFIPYTKIKQTLALYIQNSNGDVRKVRYMSSSDRLEGENMNGFNEKVSEILGEGLKSGRITTLQPTITKRCNQSCTHCHHEAGPEREEMMDRETIDAVIQVAKENDIPNIDITGGAPEMNPHLMDMIRTLKKNGHYVKVRTNLTILLEEEYSHLPEFYRDNEVELIASLPCYEKDEVDCVRGEGVFKKSIEALKVLNSLGYGKELKLDLVFNPMADFLPPSQDALKEEYTKILFDDFGIVFTELFTITNMPVGRFASDLKENGKFDAYMDLLIDNFNPSTIDNLMCLSQLNIGCDGTLYDCDFNQAISMKVEDGHPANITDLAGRDLKERKIVTGDHCFGCTAGAGSSCGGALSE